MASKVTIVRWCYTCKKNTRYEEYGYTKHTERYCCNQCGNILEYQV